MTSILRTRVVIHCLAVVGCILVQCLCFGADQSAANTASVTRPPIRDIRMQVGGNVVFHVQDAAGIPQPRRVVTIGYQGHTVATAVSNASGQVRISGLRPGIHVLASGQSGMALRLWNAEVAPPSALNSTAVIVSQPVVRGQYGAPMMGPGMLATGAAVAGVVVVIAGKNSTNESVPVSDDTSSGPASP